MDAIRIVYSQHYDPAKGRFQSLSFKPHRNGEPISIISEDCIIRSGRSICQHLRTFYAKREPVILWRFSTDILPGGGRVEQEDSSSGDPCHHNIVGLSVKTAHDIFIQCASGLENMWICNGDALARLSKTEAEYWHSVTSIPDE